MKDTEPDAARALDYIQRDNNFCELQLRDFAVGRKNDLFAGNDEGGRRAAVMYSIIRTCAVNGVEPVVSPRVWIAKGLG